MGAAGAGESDCTAGQGGFSSQRARLPRSDSSQLPTRGSGEPPENWSIPYDLPEVALEVSRSTIGSEGSGDQDADRPHTGWGRHPQEPYAPPGGPALHRNCARACKASLSEHTVAMSPLGPSRRSLRYSIPSAVWGK